MNLINKLKFYRSYCKILKAHKKELKSRFNIELSLDYRMYTLIEVPKNLFESYSMSNNDIDKISSTYIREFNKLLVKYLDSIGLREFYDIYSVNRGPRKFEYVIFIGFSMFNTYDVLSPIVKKYIPMLLTLLVGLCAWIFLPKIDYQAVYDWFDLKKLSFIAFAIYVVLMFSRKKIKKKETLL